MGVEPPVRDLADRLADVGPLADPRRRSIYLYVTAQPHEVSRDEAAAGAGVSRAVAAFHLDKLVEGGLLEAGYRRLSGRAGPGAGRPAKLYRRSARQHEVSLPPRNYELAAELLAQAVDDAGDSTARSSVTRVGRRLGEDLGRQVRSGVRRGSSGATKLEALSRALERYGYEPWQRGGLVRLRNCPFHALAQRHRDLVCGMNLALMEGAVAGMEADALRARADSTPGQCCVTVAADATVKRGNRRSEDAS